MTQYLRTLSRTQADALCEIRIYSGRKTELVFTNGSRQHDAVMARRDMDDLMASLTGHALYSAEAQMAQGFIPLPGGHRAGVCGRMRRDGTGYAMGTVTSVCIRIARQVEGAGETLRRHLLKKGGGMRRVLVFGPPGCGKTTVLRDAALMLSDSEGLHIAAADEREELFAQYPAGRGCRLDVLSGMPKADAVMLLLRAMAPQGIVTDEIGGMRDALALADAARCGVGLLASAHADSLQDVQERPMLSCMRGVFERMIHMGKYGRILHVYDDAWREIREENGYGELGCRGDGDDCCKCSRISDCGR